MQEICSKTLCTGCTACANICPVNAIHMIENAKGFLEPVIHSHTCVNCGKCKNVCPICNPPEISQSTSGFAYQCSDNKARFLSTSGGFFFDLANYIIDNDGFVCGASYNKQMVLEHIIVSKHEEVLPLQKSKYVQSELSDIFRKIKDLLGAQKLLLFVGLPCQVAGLSNFLGQKYDNLILVDLVCYGVPSPGLFKEWIDYLNQKYQNRLGKVTNVIFRDKTYGYATPNVKICFCNGQTIETCDNANVYANFF